MPGLGNCVQTLSHSNQVKMVTVVVSNACAHHSSKVDLELRVEKHQCLRVWIDCK